MKQQTFFYGNTPIVLAQRVSCPCPLSIEVMRRQSHSGPRQSQPFPDIVICIISVGRPALVANLHLNTKFCRGTSIFFTFAHHARPYIAIPRLNEAIYKAIHMMFFRGLSAHISWRILRTLGLSVSERSMERYLASYRLYKALLPPLKDPKGPKPKLTPAIKQISIPFPHIKATLTTV